MFFLIVCVCVCVCMHFDSTFACVQTELFVCVCDGTFVVVVIPGMHMQ